ncbi:MAG: hypothetical protein PHV39_04760 [Methanomicrobium sp.]|nr:hypothetical protein [Methanomicrobium sp.]
MKNRNYGDISGEERQTFAVVPISHGGIITPDNLENIAKTVRKYNIPIIKISSDNKIILVGIKESDINKVRRDLGIPAGEESRLAFY